MKKKIIISLTILLVLTTLIISVKEKQKEEKKLTLNETNNMISYTLDGNKTSTKPTKESGYIANTINCENRTNLVWDNTNWEAEIIASETTDVCNIDFTTNASTEGYRITVNTNIEDSIDSLSKTTVNGGKIIFYPKGENEITGVSGCNGVIEKGKLIISNITSNQTCNITVKTAKLTLYNQILRDHPTVNTRTDFDNVFGDGTATTGVIYKESTYKETGGNNNKDVYYFAGNVKDNWVEFGGYFWRIIRTNEDGSIRLLYHGSSTTATDTYISSSTAYNNTSDNTLYVGYMYGTEGSITNNRNNTISSGVKKEVDNWYKNNILNTYDSYISKTSLYCNDRASSSYKSASIDMMYYAAYERLAESKRQPTFQCGQNTKGSAFTSSPASVSDKFSVSTGSGGNGLLQYPIALLTADEISFAGGLYLTDAPNTYYYINSLGESSTGNNSWWTMSSYAHTYSFAPSSRAFHANSFIFNISASNPGKLNYEVVSNSYIAVRPVLSLKSCVSWQSGNGTPENPYTVSVDGACSEAVN